MSRWVLFLVLAGGCTSDPCAGHGGACLDVRVDGSGIDVDLLQLHVTGGGIDTTKSTAMRGHAVSLPVLVGVLIDPLTAAADFNLTVVGLNRGSEVGWGQAPTTHLAPGQHAKVRVTLTSGALPGDLGGGDGGGDGGDDGGDGGGEPAAKLSTDRDSYDFGAVLAGTPTGSALLTFSNVGTLPTGALTTSLAGANASSYAIDVDGCVGQTLQPSDGCTVSLHLTASSPGVPMAALTVSGTPGGSVQVALHATVVMGGSLSLQPGTQAFDPVLAGSMGSPINFTVSNAGPPTTGPLAVKIGGSDAGDFAVGSDGCTGMQLDTSTTCTVSVVFQPATPGGKTASLQVSGIPGGIGLATLSGNALGPAKLSAQSPLAFSPVTVGQSSADSSVSVTNAGGTSTGSITASVTGTNAGDFTVSSDGCTGVSLLPASAPCTIKLKFAPGGSGARTAKLHLAATPGGPFDVTLQGTGLAPADLAPMPASNDFLTAYLGTTTAGSQFNITNNGDLTSGTLGVMLTGTNASEFLTSNDTCTGQTLNKGSSCAVLVAFKPASYGSKSAALQVSGMPGGIASASLAGFGMDQVSMTVSYAGPGGGTVSGSGLTCNGSGCSGNFDRNSTVTLTAAPDGSSKFNGWSIGACGTNLTCMVTMDSAKVVTATFVPSSVTLTVTNSFSGGATGTVTSAPAGLSCSTASCMAGFSWNATVTLTATPGSGYNFGGWSGDCSGTSTCIVTMNVAHTVSASFISANIAFVSSVTPSPGALATYDTVTHEGLTGADNLCNSLAAAASRPGHFVAFLSRNEGSASIVNAIDRLVRASDGGAVNGWVRTDGKPVFRSKADVSAGKMLYPLRLDETGADIVTSAVYSTATGSNLDGTAGTQGFDCNDWTNLSGVAYHAGVATQETRGWLQTSGAVPRCGQPARIYCFQVDYDAPLPAPAGSGRLAFYAPFTPGTGGIGDADTACANAASGAGLSGTFGALLATASASAQRSFALTAPWSRPDGVLIVANAADLFTSPFNLVAAIDVTASGSYMGNPVTYTGASTPIATTNIQTCASWTTGGSTTYGTVGFAASTDPQWFNYTVINNYACSNGGGVYCLQQ